MFSARDFLWGVSTSAFQSEGGFNGPGQPRNNWARAEETRDVARTGMASDFWNRWRSDFELCRGLGLNAFRLGIEWTRLQPTRDAWDELALAHYAEMLAGCRAAGMEPVVTLHHFTHPEWVGSDMWLSRVADPHFDRFVERAVEGLNARLDRPIRYWITINEPNMLALNTYVGRQFPGRARIGFDTVVKAYNGLLPAHVRAYNTIHDLYEKRGWGEPLVSLNNFCNDLYYSDKVVLDILCLAERGVQRAQAGDHLREKSEAFAARMMEAHLPLRKDAAYWCGAAFKWLTTKECIRRFRPAHMGEMLDAVYRSPRPRVLDYLAFDYYDPFTAHAFRLPVLWDHEFKNKSFRSWVINTVTAKWWDWRALPHGLRFFCEAYAEDFGRPMLIAENGMALRRKPNNRATPRRDRLTRSAFLRMHVREVIRIVRSGLPLIGYLHWSLFDNYEWGTFTPRFGLYTLDYERGAERLAADHLGDTPAATYAELIREARREFGAA